MVKVILITKIKKKYREHLLTIGKCRRILVTIYITNAENSVTNRLVKQLKPFPNDQCNVHNDSSSSAFQMRSALGAEEFLRLASTSFATQTKVEYTKDIAKSFNRSMSIAPECDAVQALRTTKCRFLGSTP